jgi:hypothetical protein
MDEVIGGPCGFNCLIACRAVEVLQLVAGVAQLFFDLQSQVMGTVTGFGARVLQDGVGLGNGMRQLVGKA